jgi:hypothetical protein
MPSTTSLVIKLQRDFGQFTFTSSDHFHWAPSEQTIYRDESSPDQAALLHELSHALLNHTNYARDIQLIEMERDAWEYATSQLAKPYAVAITEEQIQDALNTYRDWLHARSSCPGCKAIGIQLKKDIYKCVVCGNSWRVNEARMCQLRRYKIPPN